MTNYHLLDFEAWLEEQESRRENISPQEWNKLFLQLKTVPAGGEKFLAGDFPVLPVPPRDWQPYHQVVLNWKKEVDTGQWTSENSAIAQLKKENRALKHRLHLHSETGFNSLVEADRLESQIQTQQRVIAEKEATIQQLQTELSTAQARIQELENEVATHLQALDTAQEWHERQKREITEQKEQVIQEKQQLQNQLQDFQQRILDLEADKQDLISQLSQAQQKYQSQLEQEKSLICQEITLIKEVIHV